MTGKIERIRSESPAPSHAARYRLLLGGLALALLLGILIAACVGVVPIPMRALAQSLLGGQALSPDQLDNIIRAVNFTSQNVGSTAATEAQFALNNQALTSLQNATSEQISTLSSANVATLATDLSAAQTAYQGSLSSGAKILQLSLLDYLH